MSSEVSRICGRRAELLRELADLDVDLARALEIREGSVESERAEAAPPLDTKGAAKAVGRSVDWFGRHREEFVSALVSRKGQRPRYSRALVEKLLERNNRSRTRSS